MTYGLHASYEFIRLLRTHLGEGIAHEDKQLQKVKKEKKFSRDSENKNNKDTTIFITIIRLLQIITSIELKSYAVHLWLFCKPNYMFGHIH